MRQPDVTILCNNCGGPKPDDRYRACPDCRAEWRARARKPGGTAERIEAMARKNERLILRIDVAQMLIRQAETIIAAERLSLVESITNFNTGQLSDDDADGPIRETIKIMDVWLGNAAKFEGII